MLRQIKAGSTSVILPIFLQDASSSTGSGLSGLVFGTSNLTCYYMRSDGTASVAVTLATIATLGTWETGGFKQVDSTHAPGLYEFDPPDAAMAAGAKWVVFFFRGATNLTDTPVLVELTATDNQDATRGGMTALPSAAAGANGGLPVLSSSAGALAYSVASIASGGIAAASFAAGAIDATAIAAGAITASEAPALANLDVAVSTRLATAGYTAPDNATISSIFGIVAVDIPQIMLKTDNLPLQPAAVGDIPTAAQNATAWGSSVIGNGRTRDYFLQGGSNKITFAADGLSYTVYMTDDTSVLYTGISTRLATTVGGLQSVDPA